MYDAEGNDYIPPEDVTQFENLISRNPWHLLIPIMKNLLQSNAREHRVSALGMLHVNLMCKALDTVVELNHSHNELRAMLRTPGTGE